MDAATAGLVGALGGAIVGAGGAWGAARIALEGAMYQADKQASSAYEQWLRQVRREVCTTFLNEARALVDGMGDLALRASTIDSSVTDEERQGSRERFSSAILRLEKKALDMALESPPDMGALARGAVWHIKELNRALARTAHGNGFAQAANVYQRLDDLTEKAAALLQQPAPGGPAVRPGRLPPSRLFRRRRRALAPRPDDE
ncbi:hypothetical protein [Streptomyces rishiriensis]|uniref:Uncharacterized protein n=1 Tax=Streptomyces rishiriensis TaxID=68264 RepID=A0ABU0P306_STRRH|nr:hypothetical protein [Streptomyces rishiriensis]MDQ0585783.1 hypothetical protein [Streptomyces rishiriensis]